MSNLYEILSMLCAERGIKGAQMCRDLGISKSLMTDLKSGRKKGVNADTAQKIANYFGVSVGYLLGEEETKNAPAENDKRMTREDFKFALFKGDGEVTDAMLDEVMAFAAFVQQRENQKKEKK